MVKETEPDTMSPKAYPLADPAKLLVPGCFSLVLNVQFRNSCQYIKVAPASTTFHMSFLPSTLTIHTEPSSAQEATLFYKLNEQTYSDLHTKLVIPKYHPQPGRISLTPEASQHQFSAKFEVKTYSVEAFGPEPTCE